MPAFCWKNDNAGKGHRPVIGSHKDHQDRRGASLGTLPKTLGISNRETLISKISKTFSIMGCGSKLYQADKNLQIIEVYFLTAYIGTKEKLKDKSSYGLLIAVAFHPKAFDPTNTIQSVL